MSFIIQNIDRILKKIRENIFLISISLFFPVALLRFIKAINEGWGRFSGEFKASFPLAYFLPSYNPDLYNSLLTSTSAGGVYFPDTPIWHYGPIHHFWLYPLTLFIKNFETFMNSVFIIYLFLIIIGFSLLYQALTNKKNIYFLIAFWTIILGCFQMNDNLLQRNIELLELFLIIVAFWCLTHKIDFLGGIVLCFAAMAKLFPFIFFPYLLIKRKFKSAFGFMLAFVIIFIATQLILGWENSNLLRGGQAQKYGLPSVSSLLGEAYFAPIHPQRG